jgi:rhodanese-related sulfurtransferase
MKNMLEVTPAKAFAMIQKGALLVDVREPGEVDRKSFDVPEIMLIPLRQLETRYKEIPADRQVIIACHSGSRSIMASRFLMNQGYKKAVNMQSGIARWAAEGLPLKEKEKQKTSLWLSQLFSKKS